MKSYPTLSCMNCIQPLELKCRVSEEGMSIILCTMTGYEISVVPCFETTHILSCRSTMLSLSSCDNDAAPSFLEHSEGSFTHEAMEVKMINDRHLEMRNIFYFLDDTFLMSISQLKEKLLPVIDPEPHWFWRVIDENKVSLRDLVIGSLQHFME